MKTLLFITLMLLSIILTAQSTCEYLPVESNFSCITIKNGKTIHQDTLYNQKLELINSIRITADLKWDSIKYITVNNCAVSGTKLCELLTHSTVNYLELNNVKLTDFNQFLQNPVMQRLFYLKIKCTIIEKEEVLNVDCNKKFILELADLKFNKQIFINSFRLVSTLHFVNCKFKNYRAISDVIEGQAKCISFTHCNLQGIENKKVNSLNKMTEILSLNQCVFKQLPNFIHNFGSNTSLFIEQYGLKYDPNRKFENIIHVIDLVNSTGWSNEQWRSTFPNASDLPSGQNQRNPYNQSQKAQMSNFAPF